MATAPATLSNAGRPVRCDARRHLRASKVGPQALAGLQLLRRDQWTAIPRFPAGEPHQRAFRSVEECTRTAFCTVGGKLNRIEMLGDEGVEFSAVFGGVPSRQISTP